MKRQKIVLTPTLKAEDYKLDDIVIATGYIKEVKSVVTKFNEEGTSSTVVIISDDSETDKSKRDKGIFANSTSINNLIEGFGEEDQLWIGKAVRVICNDGNYLSKKQLVIECIK